ncbi:Methionyl-tRNA formyltransferase-like protein [Syntrophomonas wolfei subsp. wolfei str. Goettingen G311]|uniref:Methionyl-tRNA formyltransferase-like protein n=2 Tax=Syntrophomonas wolfei TaxID=863 RepID=Q0B0E4_SYNWW|nr:Methionyl-tRNA formyltransferase-like protein [Syntrophomonas wolfei subsp. wolfei str. Goettingen G311]
MEDIDIFLTSLNTALRKIENKYFNVPNHNRHYPVFRERIYCYELYHQLRNNLPEGFPFTIHGELDKVVNISIHELLRTKKPDFVVHEPGSNYNLIVMVVKSINNTENDIINDCYKLINFKNHANYTQPIMIVFGEKEREKDEELIHNVKSTLIRDGKCGNNFLLIWHKSFDKIKYWHINKDVVLENQKDKLNITVVSDLNSWLNIYIPLLLKELEKKNHIIRWTNDVKTVLYGDLAFYLGCRQIVPSDILEKNKHNLVVHESDLPWGKGWSPLTWQILEGKNDIPIVLFEAAEKVDSGVIYLKETMHFTGTELVEELRATQADTTFKLCLEFIDNYPDIIDKAVSQEGESSYYRRRTPEDSRLDPDKTIREQFDLLRVVDNKRYPAFFELNGEQYLLKVLKKGN